MTLSDQLDELLRLAKRADGAEQMATANVPYATTDPAPLKAQVAAAKKAFLEDFLSKSETVDYLRELQTGLEKNLARHEELVEARRGNPHAYGSMKYYEGAACYVRDTADDIQNGVAKIQSHPVMKAGRHS